MSDIRGLIVQSRLDYIENFSDENTYQKIKQKLNEPARQAIGEQVFLTNLYHFRLLKELDLAIGESLGSSLESIFREIGKNSANLLLDRYFYNYIHLKSPHGFLSQLERLYTYIWNFGNYSYQKFPNHSAQIKFDYDEDIHKPYCWYMQSFLLRGVELCGGKNVQVKELKCEAENGESCIYRIQWEDANS